MNDLSRIKECPPLVELRGVTKRFRIGGEVSTVFDGLNLQIEEGAFVAIMGPSGSGKSTLLNMLAGIDTPDAGSLRIGLSEVSALGEGAKAKWRAKNLGIVFQFYNLLPMLTAAQNIELPLLLRRLSADQRRVRVQTVLDLVGLADRANQRPTLMSGGQQQRVGIARALVSDPALLLCDEPTGDLDRATANDILAMLGHLNRSLGKTIVMVTHDPEAAAHATRLLHLDKGVFSEGKPVRARTAAAAQVMEAAQ